MEKILILEWGLNYVFTYKRPHKFKESTLKLFLDGVCRILSGLVEHMLEKSPLTHSFTCLVGAIRPNITAIKSNRGSCEAKMAKLLLKLVSQERIGVKRTTNNSHFFCEGRSYFSKEIGQPLCSSIYVSSV